MVLPRVQGVKVGRSQLPCPDEGWSCLQLNSSRGISTPLPGRRVFLAAECPRTRIRQGRRISRPQRRNRGSSRRNTRVAGAAGGSEAFLFRRAVGEDAETHAGFCWADK